MRKITELVWHCTATPEGREVSIVEIDAWHKARGWSGIGYHKVVHLDGSISEGRPASRVGAHVANRNSATLGYCYVGGLDAKMAPKDTHTDAQKRTMERLTREAIFEFKLALVSGHHDYAAKACPCFPARAEYAPLFSGGKPAPAASPALAPAWPKTAMGVGTVTAVSGLRFRDAPDGRQTGNLVFGQVVDVYGHDGDWLLVETPNGHRGYVSDRWVVLATSPAEEIAPPIADNPAKTDFNEDVETIIEAATRLRDRAA